MSEILFNAGFWLVDSYREDYVSSNQFLILFLYLFILNVEISFLAINKYNNLNV